jgi:hypothetical protein
MEKLVHKSYGLLSFAIFVYVPVLFASTMPQFSP